MKHAERVLSITALLALCGGVAAFAFLVVRASDPGHSLALDEPDIPDPAARSASSFQTEEPDMPHRLLALSLVDEGLAVDRALEIASPTPLPDDALDRVLDLVPPMHRAYARWVASEEAAGFTVQERATVGAYLTFDAPIALRPGEARWIVERCERNDWRLYAHGTETVGETLRLYLGVDRIQAEAPPDWLAELRTWYEDDEWERLFGPAR